MIYLDNAATTKIHPEVVKAMMPYLTEQYGNAGSLYRLGRESAEAVTEARRQVATLLGCEPENVIFTSGGTEANNLAIKGLADYLIEQGKTHIITTQIEHDSIIHATEALIKRHFDVTYLPVNDECKVSPEAVTEALRDTTGLVAVMYANNETGAIQPVEEIAQICRKNNILFLTDCVQAAGFQDINVERIGCDFLSISSHKIHGCKGMGALYTRDKNLLTPLISGGNSQEFGLRGGTENVAGIVGFGKACELARKNLIQRQIDIGLSKGFMIHYLSEAKTQGVDIGFNALNSTGKVINLRCGNVDAQTLVLMLDTRGICVSAGSACRSLESEPSRVLKAIGLTDEAARSSIRLSFSEHLSDNQAEDVAKTIVDCIRILEGYDGKT